MEVFSVGSVKKRFLMAESCLEHISKLILIGKSNANYLKHWSRKTWFFKNCWKPSQKMRLDALIIFHIEWRHQVSCSMGKQSKYWSEENETENHVFFKNGWKPSQKTRLDALIIFHIEWQHQVSSLVGKQSKYWINQVIAMFMFCSIMVSLCTPCSCHDPTMFPPCPGHVPAMFPPCSRRVPWTPSLFVQQIA